MDSLQELKYSNDAFNKIIPFLETHSEFIATELYNFINNSKIKYSNEEIKKLIGFKLHKSSFTTYYYIDDKFITTEGTTHYTTLCCYDYSKGIWNFFWGRMSLEERIKICNFVKNKILRKIKIEKLIINLNK